MLEGYRALHEGAACLDLSNRGRLFVFGRDRARLLHNLTTNDVKQLQPGQGCYAFMLTPQGRIQTDVSILCLEDRFLLDTEPETRDRLPELLRKYIIADDVKLEDAAEGLRVLGVEGPRAAEVLVSLGAPVPEADYAHAAWNDALVAHISFTGQPGFRVFIPSQQETELAARLTAAGAVVAPPEAARIVRIENVKPRYSEDIIETTLPQETGQLHAIHFEKGCYLGQEIVERIRARGHVNRQLVGLELEGNEPPAPGTKLDAGEITSAAFSPGRGKVVALAYARVR